MDLHPNDFDLAADLRRSDRPYLVVGLTGSIGTGKSAAAARFAELGAIIIDADVLARRVVEPGGAALAEIAAHFGPAVLLPSGHLDRKALGEIVFNAPAERRWLEGCLHPRIRALYNETLFGAVRAIPAEPNTPRRVIVYVIPLLFEATTPPPHLDYVAVVTASPALSIERIMARDHSSRELAEKKLRSQIPIEEKAARADFVLRNEAGIVDLSRAVDALYTRLLELPPNPDHLPIAPAPIGGSK